MSYFFFFLGLLQCALLWALSQAGQKQLSRAATERGRIDNPDINWPSCALIIPVYGDSPIIEAALRSLLLQNYPDYSVFITTASSTDPACALIERLKANYPGINHVVAGPARNCGQKNHNLLAAVEAAGPDFEIYAFCDSTHMAEADFLRCLILPLAMGRASFCAGYHEVIPESPGVITMAYALNVLFMRFLQGISNLTQPWGGAMAMTRHAFEQYAIADLWAENVVDDCSLGAYLQKRGIKTVFCPAALLRTIARSYSLSVWEAWLKRQILFLKFCFPGQWACLCLFSCFMLIPFIWAACGVYEGLFNFGSIAAPFLALAWLLLFLAEMTVWRKFIPGKGAMARTALAFFLSCCMLFFVSLQTVFTNKMHWNNITYQVGRNGKVLSINRD